MPLESEGHPRSCYSCNSKKIRCDKKEPCSSCTRAGRPAQCAYPPLGPRKRRAKKTIIAEMASRLSNLEKSVAKVREEETLSPGASNSTSPATTLWSGDLSKRSREDILVQKGSSSQYFNEIIFSRVIEEERNVSQILTPPHTGSSHLEVSSAFNALGILSSPSSSITLASFHPLKQLAVRLWNTYVENVEGCSGLKLLHLPTDEIKVYSTIDSPATASPENLALVFAIYFAATVALDDSEATVVLGQDKHSLLLQFKVGLEQAFAHGDFLDRPTITGLHAMAIYLSALRVHNHGKGIWILNGLAIRMAQSLGLHRDGRRLGLSPFQSEIRRRLWWHLLTRDGRAGEDYGLQDTGSLLLTSDVGLPTNLDDTDLHPEMQLLPAAKEGWTAMTFTLIGIDLAQSMQKLATVAASSSSSSFPPSEDTRAKIIKGTRTRIEKWISYCNTVIPQQRLTFICSRFLLRKLDFITRLQWTLLQRPGSHINFATEKNLSEALEILEPKLYSDDGLLEQFAWARKAYPQYHVSMYVLCHLCVKPEGPNIDRAWETIEFMFSQGLGAEFTVGFGSKLAALTALREKAMSVRQNIRNLSSGGNVGMSHRSPRLGSGEIPTERQNIPVYPLGDTGGDAIDLDTSTNEWLNWSALVQGFQLDGPDILWQ